jgi:hypothetical protein
VNALILEQSGSNEKLANRRAQVLLYRGYIDDLIQIAEQIGVTCPTVEELIGVCSSTLSDDTALDNCGLT